MNKKSIWETILRIVIAAATAAVTALTTTSCMAWDREKGSETLPFFLSHENILPLLLCFRKLVVSLLRELRG